MTKKCPACGVELDLEEGKYCPQCGTRVSEDGRAGSEAGGCPVRLEINDNHFYMAKRAGVLDFRLHNLTDRPFTGVVLTVRSAYLGSPRDCRLDLSPGRSRRERVQVTPSVSGEHLIDLTVRLEVEGDADAYRAQPILKVLDEDVAPADVKVVIDQSMHAESGSRLGFGQTVQNEVRDGFASGIIRTVNDLLTQSFGDQWEEVPLDPAPELAAAQPAVPVRVAGPSPAPPRAETQAPAAAPVSDLPEVVLAPEQIEAARSAGVPPAIDVDLGSGVLMRMVFIPTGEFLMGSPANEQDRRDDEGPQHHVEITRGFYLGITEITQAQWRAVMGTTPWQGEQYAPSNPEHPVTCVSCDDCWSFMARLTARGEDEFVLPTEAQWEDACRAGSASRFYYGDDPAYSQLAQYAWYSRNALNVGEQYPHPVGLKVANRWGLYDMHGNVWEWCADWYDGKYYVNSPAADPPGPANGTSRVMRGGSWLNESGGCRSASRYRYNPTVRTFNNGFRCVRTVLPPAP